MNFIKDQELVAEDILLTIPEAARELRCSRSHLYHIQQGSVPSTPPLPVLRIGRKTFIRRVQLKAWVRALEDREREANRTSGLSWRTQGEFDGSKPHA